jgi:hypothetical protein
VDTFKYSGFVYISMVFHLAKALGSLKGAQKLGHFEFFNLRGFAMLQDELRASLSRFLRLPAEDETL